MADAIPVTVRVGGLSVRGFPNLAVHLRNNEGTHTFVTRKQTLPKPGDRPALMFRHTEAEPELQNHEESTGSLASHLKGALLTIDSGARAGQYYLTTTADGNALIVNVTPQPEKVAGSFMEYLGVGLARAGGLIPEAPKSRGFDVPTPTPIDTPQSALADSARAFMVAGAGGLGAGAGFAAGQMFYKAIADRWMSPKVEQIPNAEYPDTSASPGPVMETPPVLKFAGAELEPGSQSDHDRDELSGEDERPAFGAPRSVGSVVAPMGRLPLDG